ncbi:hypothetical protein KY330_03530 [Candidatus Woesearchaeota archaeon]|nr:hypothetical protein [Candidatus Woesearchaeota archaeon]
MYKLTKLNGSFKGTIAECMFKLVNEKVVITKFFNKKKYFDIFGKYFDDRQKQFLEKNWYSIDAIEVRFVKGVKQLLLFEIKSQNAQYSKIAKWPLKITASTHRLYTESRQYGFRPILAKVICFDNWNFEVETEDFETARWTIDRPKKYDKK